MGRIITLDASGWKTPLDFYDALLPALGAPHWHGRSVNALIDSMVYGGINAVEPPYEIHITGTTHLPPAVRQELDWMVADIKSHQGDKDDIQFLISA